MSKTTATHPQVFTAPVGAVARLSFREFQERVRHLCSPLVGQGARVLSFFGSPGGSPGDSPERIHLNLAFLENGEQGGEGNGTLGLLRTEVERGGSLHSLSRELPLFHCFEREISEQYGIRWLDAPWAKPLRYSGAHPEEMKDYPFYVLEGKEIHEVGVGPVHAGVIEPGHFRFMCYGETVHHLEIQLGYQHRGVEGIVKRKPGRALAPWMETVAGDTTIAHTWAYCQAWEALCGFTSPLEMDVSRGLALELERIAMHLVGLAGLATDIAFLPGGSTYGRLRTAIINSSMRLCGSRFGRGWLRPGEVRFDASPERIADLRRTLAEFARDLAGINDHFLSARTVHHRLAKTGRLSRSDVQSLGFVGMVARSTGVPADLRAALPGQLYSTLPIEATREESGDCWARAKLRVDEIDRSLEWIHRALDFLERLPAERLPAAPAWKGELGAPAPNQLAISVVEGWRGEVFHFVETDGEGKIRHYKLQDPSLRNWFALAQAVRGNEISDFPICNKSFDLSYCGHDL